MAKKIGKAKGRKRSPSSRKAGAGRRPMAAKRGGKRKMAGARTPSGKARRKQSANPPRAGKLKRPARKAVARGSAAGARPARDLKRRRSASPKAGGTGREETLARTPEAGRTRQGRTNPMGTKRSRMGAGARATLVPRLERQRRTLREIEEGVPTPPSSLHLDQGPSAARSGRQKLQETRQEHTETSPVMTGGDVDADWEDAYSVGDEAPGGDNPTPDQDRVDDIGKALGVVYEDNEELKASDKIADRDRHRWELDPASSEDYRDRD
jgi:hypothetical protein